MINEFDMYVYGSLDAYLGVLNAVAMVFNQSGFMSGVYLLGGLLMLVLTLAMAGSYTAGPQQILKYVAVFATLVSLGSIKTTLTVQDIYTGQMNKVDNVPLIMALPASISTTAFYGILNKTSTAYQGANASYVSISTGGFMDPLKELLAMRTGLTSANPALADTLRSFIVNCWNNPKATGSIENLIKSQTGLKYLLDNGGVTPAWTVNYINAANTVEGDPLICGDAADKIWAEAQAYTLRDAGTSPSLVAQVMTNLPNIGPRLGGGLPSITATDLNDTAASTLRALASSGTSTQDQMLNLLTMNLVGDTFGCIQESGGSATELTKCTTHGTALTQGLEQWKADAAGNASFFQGIMIPASMFIQMLAIALFPLIFITAILAPGKSMQIMMGYLVLMVWSASWAPVAGAIQWVMQMVLNQDIANYKSGINYGNAMQFYNTLSKDLAIGADMMAATPLIAMAVLTGSVFAFTQLAGRWSSDRVNEKIAAPDLQSPGAVNSVGSRQTTDAGLGSSYTTGESLSKLDVNSALSQGISSSRTNALRMAENWGKTHEFGSEQAKGLATSLRESMSATDSVMKKFDKSEGFNQEDKSTFQSVLSVGAGTGSLSPVQLQAQIQSSAMTTEGKSKAMQWVESNSSDLKQATEKSRAVDESMRSFSRMSQSHGYQEGVDAAKNYQESAALARGMGVSQSIAANQFGQYYRDASESGRMQFDQLRGVAAKEFMPGGELYGRNKAYSGMSMGSDYGMVESLLKSSNSRHVQMGAAMVGALSGASVSSNYGEFSGLRTPTGSGIGGGEGSVGGSPIINDPTAKVRAEMRGTTTPGTPVVSNSAVLSAGLGAAKNVQSSPVPANAVATPVLERSTGNETATKVRISPGNGTIQSSPMPDKSGTSLQPPGAGELKK